MNQEAILVAAAQWGDLGAFGRLVQPYEGLAHYVAYNMLKDADAAADATQDCLLKSYRALGHFNGGWFKAWLMRILVNTCNDHLRAQRRRPQQSLEGMEAEEQWSPWLIDRSERPHETAERRELRSAIQCGVGSLSVGERTVIVLSDVDGLSYAEIAQVTGMAIGTVKSRLSRARARMRHYLLGQPGMLPASYTTTRTTSELQSGLRPSDIAQSVQRMANRR